MTLTDGYYATPASQTDIRLGSALLATTTTLTATPNPSNVGQEVQLTAIVASSGGMPTGSVEFRDGATLLGTVNLNAGTTTLKLTTMTAGDHVLTADYSGDTNFSANDSNTVTQKVNPLVPNALVFSTQPGGAVAGKSFTTQPVIKVVDSAGNLLNLSGQVTIALKPTTNSSQAKLSGITTVNISNGIATFTNLSIDLAGTGYVLVATSPNLTTVESQPFAVVSTDTCPGVPLGRLCAQYFNNRTLQGSPVLSRFEDRINYDWGNGSPDPKVNKDNFSARWQGKFNFEAGTYTFRIVTDDGMRLYVDGKPLINVWWDQSKDSYQTDLQFKTAGVHEIKVEYYEHLGKAVAKVNWFLNIASCSQVSVGQFCASYYNSRDLSGVAALVRAESNIDFDWDWGSPKAGVIRNDNFSARWVGQFQFNSGLYTFQVNADDGIRVYVDGKLLISQWKDQLATEYTAQINLSGGLHEVKAEYYDHFGEASAILNWSKN
ncbi:PA14 domain-containing protein [Candidatus Chlorohelix allophototropha]|uniref:PA14 domain-containing protein n=1 Tax=Candidatus Chlorohelix allophototropha TaxID=3003348 RepID=A0ABY9B7J8_9CHLR|nr:PA14 domain-containing protein [Chloroflexota bacterium L227-S17]